MSEWVSIQECLPKKDALYLIYAPSADPDKPFIHVAWFNPKNKLWTLNLQIWIDAMTHWMPLPEPPETS